MPLRAYPWGVGRSNDKNRGRSTFVDDAADASEAAAAVFTQTHADPLPREAPLGPAPSREPSLLLDDDDDPTKVLAGAIDERDTEVGIPHARRPPPTPATPPRAREAQKAPPQRTPRPKRRSKKEVDASFADEPAHVSSAAPVAKGDQLRIGQQSGGHPTSATHVGPTLVPFGRYQLVKRLAFGGMGEIWLAAQRAPGGFSKLVAIKRLLSHYQGDDNLTGMFFDEARLQALLSDRHIVQIYDMGEEDNHLYIAMEYVHGVSFKQILDRAKKSGTDIPLSFLCDLAIQTCRGLSYAHNVTDARGEPLSIVHRDINPHNLLTSFGGEVKIIDFGIAKSEMSAGRTETGTIKGKFAYMSPEQSAAEALDRRSDIFSLGIVLYELITGSNPFHRQNVVLSLEAIQRFSPPTIETLRPEAAALAPLVERALSKDANKRFADCGELGEELLQLMEAGTFDRQPCTLGEWLHALFAPELEEHSHILQENGLESGFVRRAPSGTSPGVASEMSDYARRAPSSGASPASPPSSPADTRPSGPPVPTEEIDIDLFSGVHSLDSSEFTAIPSGSAVVDGGGDLGNLPDIAAPMTPAQSTVSVDTNPTGPNARADSRSQVDGLVVPPPAVVGKKRSKLSLFLGATVGAFLTVGVGFGVLWFLSQENGPKAVVESPEALPEAQPATGAAATTETDNAAPKDGEAEKATDGTDSDEKAAAVAKAPADSDAKEAGDEGANGEGDARSESADAKKDDGESKVATAKTSSRERRRDRSRKRRSRSSKEEPTRTAEATKSSKNESNRNKVAAATTTAPDAAAKIAMGVKTLKGSSVGSQSAVAKVGTTKTFKAKNAEGLEVRVKMKATKSGAAVTVEATPWAILRVGAASKGRTPKAITVTNRAALSLKHPTLGEISMIISAKPE